MKYKEYLKLVEKRNVDMRVELIGIERAARAFKYPFFPHGWQPERQIYFRNETLNWGEARFRLNRIRIPSSVGNEELAYYFKMLRNHAFVYKGKIERFNGIPDFYSLLLHECGVFRSGNGSPPRSVGPLPNTPSGCPKDLANNTACGVITKVPPGGHLVFNGFYEYNIPKIENRRELVSRIQSGLVRIA